MECQDPGPPKAMLKDFPAARSSRIERAVEGPLAEHPGVPHSHHVIIVREGGLKEKTTVGFLLGPCVCCEVWDTGFRETGPQGACVERVSYRRWDLSMSSEHLSSSPQPSPCERWSDKAPDTGLGGYLVVYQSGLACGHLFTDRRSGGFPYDL